MKTIKRYIESFERFGFLNTLSHILSKFNIKFRFHDSIWKKRIYLSKKLNKICEGQIIDGIYKGTKLIYSSDYFIAKPSQLLGCYEKEVQEEIYNLSKKNNLESFINLGAGEGYHTVGSKVAKLFKYFFCYELDKSNQEIIKKNFQLNGINENINIFSKADINFLKFLENKINFSKSLFLFDIEGDEFKILDEKNINIIKNSYLIIELHHFYLSKKEVEEFYELLNKYFNIRFCKTGNRIFSKFKILDNFNDDEKWLMMSESRPETMGWIICEPINKN